MARYYQQVLLTAIAVIFAAGVAAAAAGWLLWWAAHRSALWNFAVAILLGLGTIAAAVVIAYLMTRAGTVF